MMHSAWDCLRLNEEQWKELEQLLIYTVYPEAYAETPINKDMIFDILTKVEERPRD